jgi:hypothetical protein
MYPTSKYILGKVKEINQLNYSDGYHDSFISHFITICGRFSYTARYLSTAKLVMLRTEAVHDMK